MNTPASPPVATIGDAAIHVLQTAGPADKALLSRRTAGKWLDGALGHEFPAMPPLRPARPQKPELLPPKFMPKRRKSGSRATMVALLHAVAHIEFNAIDLAWDMVARFGAQMPREFADDWIRVADDEARHFEMMEGRLGAYQAAYGDCPAHDGLWQSALDTRHNLKARLAVVPMVLEARGLDVTPAMIARMEKNGDRDSANALRIIYREEISHVHAGQKWFNYLCRQENIAPKETYQNLVRRYFRGALKPPFNREARADAGFDENYYLPLAPD